MSRELEWHEVACTRHCAGRFCGAASSLRGATFSQAPVELTVFFPYGCTFRLPPLLTLRWFFRECRRQAVIVDGRGGNDDDDDDVFELV